MGENYEEVRRSTKGIKGESHRGKFVGDRGNEDKRDKIVSGDGRRNKILTRVHDTEEVRGDRGCEGEGEWGPGRRRPEVDETRGIYEIYL